MMGIMGISAAFAQAAGNAHAVKNTIAFTLKEGQADPIFAILGTGKVTIASTKGGEAIEQTVTLTDDAPVQVSIQADGGTMVTLIGNVIQLVLGNDSGMTPMYAYVTGINASGNTTLQHLYCGGCADLTALDLSNCTALTSLSCNFCANLTALDLSNCTALTSLSCYACTGLTALDLSNCTALTSLGCENCTGLTALDLSNCTALTSLRCSSGTGLKEIRYPATNSDVATAIAVAISYALAADGIVYTDSAGAYYNTIADAASAKGWTIEQL